MRLLPLAIAPLCVSLAALPALRAELSIYLNAGHSYETRHDALRDGEPIAGWSTKSHVRLMETCFDVLANPRVWDEGTEPRNAIGGTCRQRNDTILARSPADSYAWAVRAYIHYSTFRFDSAFDALERSHAAAPEEMWIASFRGVVFELLFELMEPDDLERYISDLRVLALSAPGRDLLIRKYIRNTTVRDHILSAVDSLDEQTQRSFVRGLRRTLDEQGAS